MRKKKTMKLWQMLPLVILIAALFIVLFLPAYHFNGDSVVKMMNKAVNAMQTLSEYSEDDIEEMKDEMDQIEEQADEEIEAYEEETGVKISSISLIRVMLNSAASLLSADDEEAFSEDIEAIWTAQRIMLWIVYVLALIVILIIILGFCFKWTKFLPLILSAVYGLLCTVVFAVFRFAYPVLLMGAGDGDMNILGLGLAALGINLSSFFGIAFLIGMILSAVILVFSVVCMFVGNSVSAGTVSSGHRGGMYDNPPKPSTPLNDPGTFYDNSPKPPIQHEEPKAPPVKVIQTPQTPQISQSPQTSQTQPMGQVKCTKGVAYGRGFSLPEGRKVIVGKSTQNANLIVNYPHVSNIHCSVTYRAATNSYIVKDHSMNGTYVNGVRLPKDKAMEYPAGTVLQLADGSNEITLG